jgi:hypothetical protein
MKCILERQLASCRLDLKESELVLPNLPADSGFSAKVQIALERVLVAAGQCLQNPRIVAGVNRMVDASHPKAVLRAFGRHMVGVETQTSD